MQHKPKLLCGLIVILSMNPGLRNRAWSPLYNRDTCLCLPTKAGKWFCLKRKPKGIMYRNLNRWGMEKLLSSCLTQQLDKSVICWVSYQDRSAEAGNAILQYHDHSNSTGIWHHGRISPTNLQSGKRYGFPNPGTDLKAQKRQLTTACHWNCSEKSMLNTEELSH